MADGLIQFYVNAPNDKHIYLKPDTCGCVVHSLVYSGHMKHFDIADKAIKYLEENNRGISPEELSTYLKSYTGHDVKGFWIDCTTADGSILSRSNPNSFVEARLLKSFTDLFAKNGSTDEVGICFIFFEDDDGVSSAHAINVGKEADGSIFYVDTQGCGGISKHDSLYKLLEASVCDDYQVTGVMPFMILGEIRKRAYREGATQEALAEIGITFEEPKHKKPKPAKATRSIAKSKSTVSKKASDRLAKPGRIPEKKGGSRKKNKKTRRNRRLKH